MLDIFSSVELVDSLDAFVARLPEFRDRLILPHWNGSNDRNRTGYVTAICEAFNLAYIGADTMARLTTNDKWLSKPLLAAAGLDFPKAVFLSPAGQLFGALEDLDFPVIVKPNCEGSSMGISDDNVVTTPRAAEAAARRLLAEFREGVIVEEFVEGHEYSFSFMKIPGQPLVAAGGERYLTEKPDGLVRRVYSTEMKMDPTIAVSTRPVPVPDNMARLVSRLFESVGGCDYIRLDTREQNGRHAVMEITADPLLVPDAAFIDELRQRPIVRELLAEATVEA